jgi:hypothetical protein
MKDEFNKQIRKEEFIFNILTLGSLGIILIIIISILAL